MQQSSGYVLITGSSSGIGEALARQLAPNASLILHGRNAERLGFIHSDLPNAKSHRIWLHNLEDTVQAGDSLRALLCDSGATVRSFVHCAGAAATRSSRLTDPITISKLFQVNVFSATAILKILLKRRINGGALRSVVFMSCTTSRCGTKGLSAHAATKGALESLCRSLAVELAPKVRVNTIVTAGIRKRSHTSERSLTTESALQQGYLLGEGYAEDVALMAEYLISERARWITGQQFVVDGGKTAH